VNILLLGSGGREHAYAYFISKSSTLNKLFIAPGNAGTSLVGENVLINPLDFNAVWDFCIKQQIDLLVPGNEDPLCAGIADFIQEMNSQLPSNKKIAVAGPDKYCAQLEGSKDFAKRFMFENLIPTAKYMSFDESNIAESDLFFDSLTPPYVLKADGLAAGKGVIITSSLTEAKQILNDMIIGKMFGNASNKVVVEEFLDGIEISVFAVSDGEDYKILGSAKDYKRIMDGDQGPNTGGMGAISPVPFADNIFMKKVEDEILKPTFEGLKSQGHPFKGFLFLGLMNINGDPKVIEYNVRMGDPETEAIFPRLECDMVELLLSIAKGGISEIDFELKMETAATIFAVSAGYPGTVNKGETIGFRTNKVAGEVPEFGGYIFHAGTKMVENQIVTNGGRVIAVTCLGESIEEATSNAYELLERIEFNGKFNRNDIGKDLLKYSK
jgi:phosphoribosylamine--glycine ligase